MKETLCLFNCSATAQLDGDQNSDKPSDKELCLYITTNPSVLQVWEKVCEGVGVTRHEIEAVKRDQSTAPRVRGVLPVSLSLEGGEDRTHQTCHVGDTTDCVGTSWSQ